MDVNTLASRPDFDRIVRRFEAKRRVSGVDDCWLWTDKPQARGYGVLAVQVDLKTQLVYAHRLAYYLARGPIPAHDVRGTLLVCHKCDERLCVNPAHLFLGTDGDNMRDKVSKGRDNSPFGERSPKAKFTSEQILAIRADTRGSKAISADYGISASYIPQIKSGKFWRHLDGPPAARRKRGQHS